MSKAKNVLAATMILLPLIVVAVVKFGPAFLPKVKISSVAILPAHVYAPGQYNYMIDDAPNRIRETLATIPDLRIQRTPLPREVGEADRDLVKLAGMVGGADVLVQPTLTLDEGILELDLEAVDPVNKQVIYNEIFDSPLNQYAQMIQSAATALKHAIER
jgi:hypothetical protein